MVRDQLAKRLRQYRERAGLTIYEVGDHIGKSGKTVNAWEMGRGQPDADMLVTLCVLYNISSVSELLGLPPAPKTTDNYSAHERQLIEHYRARPDVQRAVDILLGLDD